MSHKVKPGDAIAIPAQVWNRHDDAVEFVHRNFILGNPRQPQAISIDSNYVTLKNTSGANRRRGDILEIGTLATGDYSSGQIYLTGVSPTLVNAFAVLNNPMPTNGFDEYCQIAGVCVAYVNITDTSHKFCTAVASNYVLQSQASGSNRILAPETSGTGERLCAVSLQGGNSFEIHRGFTNASNSKGSSSGTVSRYIDGTNTDSTIDDTVTNDFALVGSGKKVAYVKLGSIYYLIAAEC